MRERRKGAASVNPAGDPSGRTGLRTVYYIAVAVLAMLVPLILFGGLWIRQEFAKNQRDLEEYLRARATSLKQTADAEIEQELAVLRAVAALPSLDAPDASDFQSEATRVVATVPQWLMIGLIDVASGREIANTLRTPGSEDGAAPPTDVLRRVVESRKPAIFTRGFEPGRPEAEHSVMIFVPVVREDAVRSVLRAIMKPAVIQQTLAQAADDPRLLMIVVDERDNILAHSQAPQQFVSKRANDELRAATLDRRAGLFVVPTEDGDGVFTAFSRSDVTGWVFVVATERGQFERIAARSTWTTIATGALSLTLAGLLAVFVFYNIMDRRLNAERLAASRALTDLDARLLATTQQALAEQRKSSSEREVLLREIYHRVKNNLQIIQSLLRLGSRDLGQDQREPFENAVRRIGAMARVHTLLYNSADLSSIDFKEYLEDLLEEVAVAFAAEDRGIRTVLDVEPMRVPLDTAVPVAFIAVELLTNAFKHAFPPGRSGTITVSALRRGEHGVLTVSDDGVGLPADARSRRALGLTIIAKLVQQIDGTLEQQGERRSTFTVTFPLAGAGHPERLEEPKGKAAATS